MIFSISASFLERLFWSTFSPRGVSLLFVFFHITLWLLLPSCCCYVFVVDVASYSTPRCVSLLFSCFFKGTCPNVVHGTCPNSSTGSLVHMGQARTSCGLFLWKGFLMAAINLTLCSTTAPSLVDDLCAGPWNEATPSRPRSHGDSSSVRICTSFCVAR